MMTPYAARGRARVAGVRRRPALPRPARYDKGDTTRGGRAGVPEDQERALFTTAEAAAQLGVSQATVRTAVNRGTLRAHRVSARLNLITAEAIEEYRRDHLGRQGRPKGATSKTAADAPSTGGRERDQ